MLGAYSHLLTQRMPCMLGDGTGSHSEDGSQREGVLGRQPAPRPNHKQGKDDGSPKTP